MPGVINNSSILGGTPFAGSPSHTQSNEQYVQTLVNNIAKGAQNVQQVQQQPQIDYNNILQNRVRTVFSDISEELNKLTTDEQDFIANDKSYLDSYTEMSNNFNKYLFERFQTEFYGSPYGQSAEAVLKSIRESKDRYNKETRTKNNQSDEVLKQIIAQNELLTTQVKTLQDQIRVNSVSIADTTEL